MTDITDRSAMPPVNDEATIKRSLFIDCTKVAILLLVYRGLTTLMSDLFYELTYVVLHGTPADMQTVLETLSTEHKDLEAGASLPGVRDGAGLPRVSSACGGQRQGRSPGVQRQGPASRGSGTGPASPGSAQPAGVRGRVNLPGVRGGASLPRVSSACGGQRQG